LFFLHNFSLLFEFLLLIVENKKLISFYFDFFLIELYSYFYYFNNLKINKNMNYEYVYRLINSSLYTFINNIIKNNFIYKNNLENMLKYLLEISFNVDKIISVIIIVENPIYFLNLFLNYSVYVFIKNYYIKNFLISDILTYFKKLKYIFNLYNFLFLSKKITIQIPKNMYNIISNNDNILYILNG
jgi:hypothetical protein